MTTQSVINTDDPSPNERSFSEIDPPRSRAITTVTAPASNKRERILDAAVHVFAQRGFFQSRVADIAREAGVADGTIYLYFKGKDDLLIRLFEDRMEGIIATFRSELAGLATPLARLRRFIEMHLALVQEKPELAEVLTVELRQSAKFMREYKAHKFVEYLGLLREILDDGRRRGVFRPDLNAALLSRIVFGALDEVSLVWSAFRRETFDPGEAAREIWNLCAQGLLAFAPPSGDLAPSPSHSEGDHA